MRERTLPKVSSVLGDPAAHLIERGHTVKITVIGAGNMGTAFVKQLTRAGHQVRVIARNADKARQVAAANPGAVAVEPLTLQRTRMPSCWPPPTTMQSMR